MLKNKRVPSLILQIELQKRLPIEGKGPVHVHLVMSKDLGERMEINMHKLGRNKRGLKGKYNENL